MPINGKSLGLCECPFGKFTMAWAEIRFVITVRALRQHTKDREFTPDQHRLARAFGRPRWRSVNGRKQLGQRRPPRCRGSGGIRTIPPAAGYNVQYLIKIWSYLRCLQTNGQGNFSSQCNERNISRSRVWSGRHLGFDPRGKTHALRRGKPELDGTSQQVNTILQCRGRARENTRSSPPQTIRSGGIQFNVVLKFAGNPPSTMAEALDLSVVGTGGCCRHRAGGYPEDADL